MVRYCTSKKTLVGKTTIVTGANTGLGYETALEFAKRGAKVYLACRNEEKANAARDRIVTATGNQNVLVKLIDMESLDSVRAFADYINTTEERLDILVNNAGVMYLPEKLTDDGLQLTMQINHFSPVLLTMLLLDLMKTSAPSRIVNVSSSVARHIWSYKVEDLNKFPGGMFSQSRMYFETKLCNILFTQELAKKLEGTKVTTYSLHPGAVATELQRNSSFGTTMANWLFKTPEQGAQTQIYLSLEDGIENLSGQHFDDSKPVHPYRAARDPQLAKDVYEKSLELVGLAPE